MVKKISEKEASYENHGAFKRARVATIKRKLPSLLDVDQTQILKALKALRRIKTKKATEAQDLFDIGDQFVYLEIVLNRMPIKYTVRPLQM